MDRSDRRRRPRRPLGAEATVHVGAHTAAARVVDLTEFGLGLEWTTPPERFSVRVGDVVWVTVEAVSAFAITGRIAHLQADGRFGIDLEELREGPDLAHTETVSLPVAWAGA